MIEHLVPAGPQAYDIRVILDDCRTEHVDPAVDEDSPSRGPAVDEVAAPGLGVEHRIGQVRPFDETGALDREITHAGLQAQLEPGGIFRPAGLPIAECDQGAQQEPVERYQLGNGTHRRQRTGQPVP